MGWASGSYLAEDIWYSIEEYIPKKKRQEVAKIIVDKFQSEDADDWCIEEDSLYGIAYPESI